jgi:hypothetical protein
MKNTFAEGRQVTRSKLRANLRCKYELCALRLTPVDANLA